MKKLFLVLILLNITTAMSSVTKVYRGMDERQSSIADMLNIFSGNTEIIVPSRRFSAFSKVFPDKSTLELIDIMNRDVDYWKQTNAVRELFFCRTSPYDCAPQDVNDFLLAGSLKVQHLPSKIRKIHDKYANGEFVSFSLFSDYFVFLDPVISTSLIYEVAKSFSSSTGSNLGYVMTIHDPNRRICNHQEISKCETYSEYPEEQEVPIFGYIKAEEVVSINLKGLKISRGSPGQIQVEMKNNTTVLIRSCEGSNESKNVSELPWPDDIKKRFLAAGFGCIAN